MASQRDLVDVEQQVVALCEIGASFYHRGWSVGTSGNFSVVVQRDPLELLITASSKDKRRLQREDFVRIGPDGGAVTTGPANASAEALLHVVAAEQPHVGAVLHTHSVWATLLSDLSFDAGGIEIEGYEMIKGLAGVTTHEQAVWIEIFDNTQNIPELAERVRERFNDVARPLQHGYVMWRHGLHTWGRDLEEAKRHVEILEFLFECEARRLLAAGAVQPTMPVD